MSTEACDFCGEFSGTSDCSFSAIYRGEPESRILFQSEEIAVIPSLGQIVEGYLLVLPRSHVLAVGDLAEGRLGELAATLQLSGRILEKEYGRYIAFEHGTRSRDVGGCGIYHAHIHVVPLAGVLEPTEKLKAMFPYVQLTKLDEIKERSALLPCYLFYQDSAGKFYIFDTGPLPSQYMRKLLADSVGEQEWNWRNAHREERLLATMARLSHKFQSGRKELARIPER